MRGAGGARGAAGVVLIALIAGCGSGSMAGEAEVEGGAAGVDGGAGEPAFSPCDDIPDDALRAVGVDPATEERDIDGIDQPGWNICNWQSADWDLAVFATTRTMGEFRNKGGNESFATAKIAGRTGFTYREASDTRRERCAVAFPSVGGTALVTVGYYGIVKPADSEQPCEVAAKAAELLLSHIPK